MSANTKLEADGTCNLCKKVSSPNEHIECFICKSNFHAVCTEINNDDKVATKTMVAGRFPAEQNKKKFHVSM